MNSYSFVRLADHVLARELDADIAQNRRNTSVTLAKLAEFDARRLSLPAAYSSTFRYCVEQLRVEPDVAYRWIRVARAGYRHPGIFPALADGRLTQTAVILLAPHLNSHTATDLLTAAVNKSKSQIELLLAARFPQPDVPTQIRPIPAPVIAAVPGQEVAIPTPLQLAPALVVPEPAQAPIALLEPVAPRARVAPLSPGRNALQVTIDDETVELLEKVKALLGHTIPNGDVAEVLKRALEVLVHQLERQKFAAVERPRPARSSSSNTRHIPAAVRRAVWKRDGARCAFVSTAGQRCEERTRLEFDHANPAARGGESGEANIRLCCRAHNQYEAERVYGARFMQRKRECAQGCSEDRSAPPLRLSAENSRGTTAIPTRPRPHPRG